MKRKLIRRVLALAGAASLCLLCASPAFAEETQWEYLEQIRFGPQDNSAAGHVQTVLSGPDVGEDGFVTLTKGETCSFTCDMTFQVPRSTMQYSSWGIVARTDLLDQERVYKGREGQQDAVHEEFFVLGTDGKNVTVARPVPASKGSLRVTFTDLALDRNARIEAGEDPTEIWPDLAGSAEIELRCVIEAVATLPLPQVERADGEWQFETRKAAEEYADAVWEALEDPACQLASPQEAVLRASYRGDIPVYTVNVWAGDTRLDCQMVWPGAGSGNRMTAVWELAGETYTVSGLEDTPLRLAFSAVPVGSDAVSTGIPVREGADAAKQVAATAAGAAALGLGGGAVVNGLNAVLENTPFARRREEFEDPDAAEGTPDLSGEDTPSVSVSFYRPFDDLVNTRGAAVDIQLTVSGGEGLRWHYLPAAVCPEGLKAVVPAVVGNASTATLVLTLTGAAMKKPHLPVFITVVAWAFTASGQLVKTTGNLELQLHRPGLEAKRGKDGGLQVTLYADGNLDGVAEKVDLKPEQYTCARQPDGSLLVEAKPPYKGSCRLAPREKE
ncbi:MAG TPA: hypothetical protein H9795_10640 [Candidatus Fournierella merdigallinarum]|nr:hypothetical protein [Candidatus Fournierella merdigallinarum]